MLSRKLRSLEKHATFLGPGYRGPAKVEKTRHFKKSGCVLRALLGIFGGMNAAWNYILGEYIV